MLCLYLLTVVATGKLPSECQFRRQRTRVGSELWAWQWDYPRERGMLSLCWCLLSFPTGLLLSPGSWPWAVNMKRVLSERQSSFSYWCRFPVVERWRVFGKHSASSSLYRWTEWSTGRLEDDFPKVSGTPVQSRSRRWVHVAGRKGSTSPGTLYSINSNSLYLMGSCVHGPSWGQLSAQKTGVLHQDEERSLYGILLVCHINMLAQLIFQKTSKCFSSELRRLSAKRF